MSRATYFRWLKCGKLKDTQFKDRNGRRVFTEEELEGLKKETDRLVEAPQMPLRFGELDMTDMFTAGAPQRDHGEHSLDRHPSLR